MIGDVQQGYWEMYYPVEGGAGWRWWQGGGGGLSKVEPGYRTRGRPRLPYPRCLDVPLRLTAVPSSPLTE